MWNSALLLLHTHEANRCHDSSPAASSEAALDLCCDFVIKRADKYTAELDTVDLDSLSPFAARAIYQASVLRGRRLAQLTDTRDSDETRLHLDRLETMLASFGQRWRAAGDLFCSIPTKDMKPFVFC